MSTAAASPRPAHREPPKFDVQRIRDDFPALHQQIKGKPLVYLDNAATTQKPRQVIEAVSRYYERDNANVHRGVHELSVRATDAYEAARVKVQRFLGAARPEEIVFLRGTTEAINLVAQSYGRKNVQVGDEIVITHMEHHSNIVPWQMLCEHVGAKLRVVPINDRGELLMDEYEKLLGPKTRLVAVVQVSNALGTVNPVREMTRLAHRHGIPVLVDGAQAVSHMKVDVQELGCDFYAFSGHKVFAPTGVGALYGRYEMLANMPAWQGGGDMIASVSFAGTTYKEPPYRFEAGTPNIAGGIGLGAAIDYVESIGRDAIAAYEGELLTYATRALENVPQLRLVGTASEKAGVLSFIFEHNMPHPHDVGTILNAEGVAIRTGHHCAQPLMERYGIPATARASLAMYNTRQEVDALAAALGKTVARFI
jgi:cysteine desulfurase / selenocysteine lyase